VGEFVAVKTGAWVGVTAGMGAIGAAVANAHPPRIKILVRKKPIFVNNRTISVFLITAVSYT
jgi:hypothetical protein